MIEEIEPASVEEELVEAPMALPMSIPLEGNVANEEKSRDGSESPSKDWLMKYMLRNIGTM